MGEPELGDEEWLRAVVEEAMADTSGDGPHEKVMKLLHGVILKERETKSAATASN